MTYRRIFPVVILNAENVTHRVRGVKLSVHWTEALSAAEALWMVVAVRSFDNSKLIVK